MRRCTSLLLAVAALIPAFSSAALAAKTTGIPRFDAAVQRAATFLRAEVERSGRSAGAAVFAGYALLKAGDPIESPAVAAAIQEAVRRSTGTKYQIVDAYHHIYVAGVDAMLLSDINPELYKANLQTIANYVQSVQRADGSWSDGPTQPGDVSMSQYGMLGLWAAQRAGCTVSPEKVDLAADFLMTRGNPDGGWGYRPGTTAGPGAGSSTHNMTMAATGSLLVARLMLHGPKTAADGPKAELIFGVLEKAEPLDDVVLGKAWPNYSPRHSAGAFDGRVNRGLGWNESRFEPVSRVDHNLYFYYCIERAASIGELDKIAGREWYTTYGDGLLTLQNEDGSFSTHTGAVVGTSFALLYFMKSTQQILDNLIGKGQQYGKRGNPFGDKETKREPTELDRLIEDISNVDFKTLDETPADFADEIVRSVTSITDPEELVGQTEKLKSLMKHPNADIRKAACWALGRTGKFELIPLMLDGIRDPSLDVNVEAISALRYIARKPHGFGETLNPMEGLDKAPPEERLRVANEWRQKVLRQWSAWYFAARPYEETSGLDELQVKVPLENR